MNRRMLFAIIMTLSIVAPVMADELSGGKITLSRVLKAAEQNNPEIRAALKRWEASQQRPVQAGTPESPRLDIERMYSPKSKSIWSGAAEKNVAVTQELALPSKLALKKKIASKEAEMTQQRHLAKVRDVLARVRSTFASLYLAEKSLEIFNENIDLMRQYSKSAESKYAAGRGSQSDALKAQVELSKMLNMRVVLQQEKISAESVLNALLGRNADAPLGTPADPDSAKLGQTLAELETAALQIRPELREARLDVERARMSVSLARQEFLPDLMLQYRRRDDSMRNRTDDAIVGFSMPFLFRRPYAMAAEAKAEEEESVAELEAMRLLTLAEVRTDFIKAQTSRQMIDLYRTGVFPQAEAALKVTEAGYQADKASFLDLVDAQRSLLNFKLEYYQFLAAYEDRLAELGRVVGQELNVP